MFTGVTYCKGKDVCKVILLVNPLIACLFFILTETRFCWVSTSTPIEGLVWSQCKSRYVSHRNWISWSCLCPPAVCSTNEAFEISQHSDSIYYYGYDYTESLLAWKTRYPVCTGNSEFNPACVKFGNDVGRDTTEAREERVMNTELWQRVMKGHTPSKLTGWLRMTLPTWFDHLHADEIFVITKSSCWKYRNAG